LAELKVLVFEETAKKLILSYLDKPNFTSLMKIISTIFTDIQTTNFELRDKFWLEDATGEQLNFIGLLWGLERSGRNNDDYRAAIYVEIERTSSGTINEIKSSLLGSYNGTFVNYFAIYPAAYILETDAVITQAELEAISPAGVGVLYYNPDEAGNEWFTTHDELFGGDRTWFVTHSYDPFKKHIPGNVNFFGNHDDVLYAFHNGDGVALHS
jgi:hypothetical protein